MPTTRTGARLRHPRAGETRRRCWHCREDYWSAQNAQGYCSVQCRRDANHRDRGGFPHFGLCEHCGEFFGATRSDARYCSTRCRVAAHRSRANQDDPG